MLILSTSYRSMLVTVVFFLRLSVVGYKHAVFSSHVINPQRACPARVMVLCVVAATSLVSARHLQHLGFFKTPEASVSCFRALSGPKKHRNYFEAQPVG